MGGLGLGLGLPTGSRDAFLLTITGMEISRPLQELDTRSADSASNLIF